MLCLFGRALLHAPQTCQPGDAPVITRGISLSPGQVQETLDQPLAPFPMLWSPGTLGAGAVSWVQSSPCTPSPQGAPCSSSN